MQVGISLNGVTIRVEVRIEGLEGTSSLIVEDSAKVVAVREDVGLMGEIRTA